MALPPALASHLPRPFDVSCTSSARTAKTRQKATSMCWRLRARKARPAVPILSATIPVRQNAPARPEKLGAVHGVVQRASLLRGDSPPRKDFGSSHLFVRTNVGCAQAGQDLQGQEPHLDRNEDNSINVKEAKKHGPC